VSEPLLNVMKIMLLAGLYLFFVRVLWSVFSELRDPRTVASKRKDVDRSTAASFGTTARGMSPLAPPSNAPHAAVMSVATALAIGQLRVIESQDLAGGVYQLGTEITLGRAAVSKQNSGAIINLSCGLLTMAALGFLPGMLLQLRLTHSAWTLLGVLLLIKSCDIGAYFTGRAIGKHKLIPWLSPGKTWEGLFGGIAFASLIGALGAWLLGRAGVVASPTPAVGALAGVLFSLVGHAGDLMASVLKRDTGVKDTGTALPGMGGLIDVLDSPLLVFPAAYWLLVLTT
jgi:CDP-diglyceride synthetase